MPFLRNLLQRIYKNCIWRIPSPDNQPVVYLTFDDGPTLEITEWVLKLLKREQVKATFFMIGKNAELYPEIVEKVLTDNHNIGNHSYSHQKGFFIPTGRMVEDVDLAANYIRSNLFRPPYGQLKKTQIFRLKERYKIIMWDVLSHDYNTSLAWSRCLKNVLNNIRNGSIIVFHDSVKAEKNMKIILPMVITNLKERGYQFKRIPY